jgi:hypothetical protein
MEPWIAGPRFGTPILKQLVHVGTIKFSGMRLGEVAIDKREPEIDTVALRERVHAIEITHAAVSSEGCHRSIGDRKRASLHFVPLLRKASVADDVGDAPSRHPSSSDFCETQTRWIQKRLHRCAAVNVQFLMRHSVDLDIEHHGRKKREDDGLELLADRLKVIQALLETEVLEIVGAELVTQECGELLVLLQEGVLEVGAIDVMAMLDLVDDGRELAGDLAV